MLILSGDTSLNPGPVYNSLSSCSNEWNIFKAKGIHLIHLNVNSVVEILLPKTKPLIVGIIHRPPNQSNFLEIIIANFEKLDTDTKESYILGDEQG